MHCATIVGTGSITPKRVLSNRDLEKIVDTNDEWITRRTGIKERRISMKESEESSTDLALQASLRAMEMAGISGKDLDMIVVGTVTPDRQFPSTACTLQHALNANNAPAFDISAGCSGFLYALETAHNAIRTGMCKTALVAGVERLSAILDWKDRSTCVLLGDGAGAVIVRATKDQKGILSTHLKSDGSFGNLLYSSEGNGYLPKILRNMDHKPFHLKMDGHRLFKVAVGCMSSIAKKALEYNALRMEDVGTLIPHQANIRIIQSVAKSLRLPMEKVFTNIHKYGNTSSASIPIALDEANRQGVLAKGSHVLLITFGAGLTWGSSLLKWCI